MASLSNLQLRFAEQIAIYRARTRNLIPTSSWRDMLRNGHDRAFVVAGAMKADLLADFADAILKAIDEGTTLEEFQADFDEIVERYGWSHTGSRDWRSRVIYNTNLTTSYAAGRQAQLDDPELIAVKPLRMYRHDDSVDHPREVHVGWDGLTLPHDHPDIKIYSTPNGWGCHCYWIAVSQRDVERLGGRIVDGFPDQGRDPKTGLPVGIQEGWDYQPGDQAEFVQRVRDSHANLPQSLRDALNADLDSIDGQN